jgi:hypothetical protein
MSARRKRAAAIAAPGAKRLVLTGIMAVPDDFGRVRVLLVDRLPGAEKLDMTWKTLADEISFSPGFTIPYRLQAVDTEGVRGEFWAVPPAHRRKHWLDVAAALRGKGVRVEATVRNYTIAGDTPAYGASLDISLIDPA